ncbi:MAG: riboflavin biosynthesis protein RibF [Tannerella sp.]|jgi:riboflavin kinase/FMN adenylyltransferase|nr:riboflavin biosynthesis protein RibF [Tannerella sp.]
MKVIRHTQEKDSNALMATVGFFDGVHCGHCFLIEELRRLAAAKGLASAVITFPVHPRIVLHDGYQPKLLNSFEEKMERLALTGVDYCVVLDFTPALADLSAHDFVEKILQQQWGVHTLLVGYDHRFGHNRADGFEQYVAYGHACGMEVLRAGVCEAGERAVSSSRIRQLLMEGAVEKAAQLLTYPYRMTGLVVHGHGLGRTLGFPTANIEMDELFKVQPGMGVYAVWVYLNGKRYKGMLSVGNRPTLNSEEVTVEVHLLHFSGIIYQQSIRVEFMYRLRNNRKFDSLDALRAQLVEDCRMTDEILSE